MAIQTILFLNNSTLGSRVWSDSQSGTNFKLKITESGTMFAMSQYTLANQSDPVWTLQTGEVDGVLTFTGVTFSIETRTLTIDTTASETIVFQTATLQPIENQIIDPVITSDQFYIDDTNHVNRLSKLTKVLGISGIIATTDATRPGEVVLKIDPNFSPTFPDDISATTLNISGQSNLDTVTANQLTLNGDISSTGNITGTGKATFENVSGEYFKFSKVWLNTEITSSLPKNTLLLAKYGEVTKLILNS